MHCPVWKIDYAFRAKVLARCARILARSLPGARCCFGPLAEYLMLQKYWIFGLLFSTRVNITLTRDNRRSGILSTTSAGSLLLRPIALCLAFACRSRSNHLTHDKEWRPPRFPPDVCVQSAELTCKNAVKFYRAAARTFLQLAEVRSRKRHLDPNNFCLAA
jgi:hypothetical protein